LALEIGACLYDRYRIERVLGRGGFGAVYLALDERLGVPCAVKENLILSSETERQFRREATLLATLRHPNLPRVTNHFITGGCQYLVMDYIEGEDLKERLRREGQIAEADAVQWALQVCEALTYLHTRNPPVIHRDIKPANIKLNASGEAILVDFGLAKAGGAAQQTTTSAMGLTPGFAPPEQYGTGGTDACTDEYALAATLYCLLTGEPPADSMERLLGNAKLVPLTDLRPDVSLAVAAAVTQALEIQPDARPASVANFAAALKGETAPPPLPSAEVEARAQAEPIETIAPPPIASQPARRWPRLLPAAGIGAALILALGAVWAGRGLFAPGSPASSPVPAAALVTDLAPIASFTAAAPTATATVATPTSSATATSAPTETSTAAPTETATALPTVTSTPPPTPTPTLAVISSANASQLTLRRHLGRGRLLSVQWSSDGRYLGARTTLGGTIFNGEDLAVVTETANFLGFGPAPDLAAVGGAKKIDVLDLASGIISETIEIGALYADAVAFSPDGQHLLIVGSDEALVLMDLSNSVQQNLTANNGLNPPRPIQAVFSPDGQYIVSNRGVWEAATGILLWTGLKSVFAVSPDSQMAADDGSIRLLRTGVKVREVNLARYYPAKVNIQYEEYVVDGLAFTGDSAGLIVFAERGLSDARGDRTPVSVLRWPVAGGGPPELLIKELPNLDVSPLYRNLMYGYYSWYGSALSNGFGLEPSGTRFYSKSRDGVLRLWDFARGQVTATGPAYATGQYPVMHPDGQTVAMPNANGIELIDLASGQVVKVLRSLAKPETIMGMAYLGQNLLIEQPGTYIEKVGTPLELILVDIQNDRPLLHFQNTEAGMWGTAAMLFTSPDGRWFSLGHTVYDAAGQFVRSFQVSSTDARSWSPEKPDPVFSPHGEMITGAGQLVRFYDVTTGQPTTSLSTRGGHTVGKLAFTPDGARLVSARGDVWDVPGKKSLATFKGGATYVAISPDGKVIAGDDGLLWDAETGQTIGQFQSLISPSQSSTGMLTFTPDGRQLLTWDRLTDAVRVWEVNTLPVNP